MRRASLLLLASLAAACSETTEPSPAALDADPTDTAIEDSEADSASEDSSGADAMSEDSAPDDTRVEDSDAVTADTFVPDTFVPDTFTPDTFTPDTFTPDTFTPDTFTPDSFLPETTEGGAGFTIEDVEPVEPIAPAIALDAAGRPHVSYWVIASKQVRYATRDATGWRAEAITPTVGVGTLHDLAMTPGGAPCVLYSASPNVRYACRSAAGVWSDELVGPGEGPLSLVIDAAGTPHAVYHNDASLKYAKRAGATWTIENVASSWKFARIALDAAGAPHVVLGDFGEDMIRHASRATGAWAVKTLATVSSGVHSITDGALAFDATGGMHVAYFYTGISTVSRGYYLPPMGAAETATPTSGNALSLELAPGGAPHLAYRYGSSFGSAVRHAYRTPGGWIVEDVVSRNGTPALAIGATGVVHIAFADHDAKMLRYARK